ncbi:AIPR family protein [Longimicrobium terrae]|uniref:Abortive phage infection protein C-terminal domain-containing protein n=1 Tax=Longimicrobium terrae TaxID=1639882 RepID=A0A841GNK6_9BACT|nr:AIPR family protein [Longimicrobium terrae]MBB4634650.1 hypothetical protein [Longimicrobium terrae]MBB6068460.1 hypothetical protein [Longimicrobium terrae]NNC27653.1 AIPR family protein [Longimicrobium terrae]
MSLIHVNHIQAGLKAMFDGLIDMTDSVNKPDHDQKQVFISRALAAYTLVQKVGLTPEAAGSAVVDSYNDNGIDAFHFDPDEHRMFIVQSKWISDGNGSPELGEVHKFLHGFRDLLQFSDIRGRFNAKVMARSAEIEAALEDSQATFSLFIAYPSNHPLSVHAQQAVDDLLSEMNDTSPMVTFQPIGQRELHRAVVLDVREDPINLEVALRDWGQRREPFQAYYGQVSASDVAAWWGEYNNRLFTENLRKFAGSTEVNEGLSGTLKGSPEHFWYFNNGITALCTRISKKPAGGPDRGTGYFVCEGVSVVNGAQTVGAIGTLADADENILGTAYVPIRFISLENTPADFATQITRATNTQNRIERRDFAALDPEQERLRTELLFEQKVYAFKTGDTPPQPDQGCTIDEATVALACAYNDLGLAVQAKREIGQLWENTSKPPYKLVFNGGVTGLHLWRAVMIMRAVDAVLRAEMAVRGGREKLVAIHGNRFILHCVYHDGETEGMDLAAIGSRDGADKLEALTRLTLERTIAAVERLHATAYPAQLFKNLGKCKQILAELVPEP